MSILQAIVLGLVQGLTEFIPVSSSGHLILVRNLFGIGDSNGLAFDAVLQLATVLAVIIYFWNDIYDLVRSFFFWVLRKGIENKEKTLILAIIFGTIPAVVLGFFLEKSMDTVFRGEGVVIATLIIGALVFFAAEILSRGGKELSYKKGIVIGLFQSLALIPGMSRSGMTISGGLFSGLSRVEATRFSFLLSVPILLGTGIKKLVDIGVGGELGAVWLPLLVGSVVAFVSGYFAIKFLVSFLKTHTLKSFAIYRIILAIIILVIIL